MGSPFTWNALLGAIPETGTRAGLRELNRQTLPPHEAIFMFQGIIQQELNVAVLLPGFDVPQRTLDPAKVQALLQSSAVLPANFPYRIRLIGNPANPPLDDRPLTLLAAEDSDTTLVFVQAMPRMAGVTRIQVTSSGAVIAEMQVSPNSPVLILGLNAPLFTNPARRARAASRSRLIAIR